MVHTGTVSPASMPRLLSPVVHVYASMRLEAKHTPFNYTPVQSSAAPASTHLRKSVMPGGP